MLFSFVVFSWVFWSCSAEEDIHISIGTNSDKEELEADTGILAEPEAQQPAAEPTSEPEAEEPPQDTGIEDSGQEGRIVTIWDSIPDSLHVLKEGVHQIAWEDDHRVYVTIPSSYSTGEELPLLVLLHDDTSCPSTDVAEELAVDLMGQLSAAVIYPQTSACSWSTNDVGAQQDIDFIHDVIVQWMGHEEIDEEQVYLVGKDSGGGLALKAGVGVSTLSGLGVMLTSAPQGWEVPDSHGQHSFVQLVNARDAQVPFSGGNGLMAVPESVLLWVEHNECDYAPETSSLAGISVKEYPNCAEGARVLLGTVLPDPWHEECQSAWQEAQQSGAEMIPPEGIECGDTHELPVGSPHDSAWMFVWSLFMEF